VSERGMDGWMDGWMDGEMDGWMDGRRDGWMDGGCVVVTLVHSRLDRASSFSTRVRRVSRSSSAPRSASTSSPSARLLWATTLGVGG